MTTRRAAGTTLDENLLNRARGGDERAWSHLYGLLAPAVRAYFRARRIRDADDLTADVFLDVARRIGDFEGSPARFRSWVFTVAHSRYVDFVRAAGLRSTVPLGDLPEPVSDADPVREVLDSAQREALVEATDCLTEDQRSVVLLRMLGDLSLAEVAEVLGKSEMAVKVLHHRGVRALRRHLEPPSVLVETPAFQAGGVTR